MKRRLWTALVIVVAAAGSTALPAHAATTSATAPRGGWVCASVEAIHNGVCIDDPTPHPLPVIVLPI